MESIVIQQLRRRAETLTAQVASSRRELAKERTAREAAERRLAHPEDAQLESGMTTEEFEALAQYAAQTLDARQLHALFVVYSRGQPIESTRRLAAYITDQKPWLAAPIRINMSQLEAYRGKPETPQANAQAAVAAARPE
jgi:hypothetical protein